MKINQVLVESTQATVAFAFGRFNPAHQGHIAVWRTVEEAGKNWFVGTNPNTIGPNDPLTFQQKSAWMEEIYPPITGHIVPQTTVLTLAAYIFKKLRGNENTTIAYVTDDTDWAWSGKLLNQYNGQEGSHGYYKFAEITHVPSPRVSSATALRDAARADDKVAFYHASGTDPKLKVAGLSYFDTVKQACEKYPLPVKRAKKVTEMDSQGYTGSRERKSMSTYGSRDKGEVSKGQDVHLGPGSMLDRNKLDKKVLDVLNKSFAKTDKKKDVDESQLNELAGYGSEKGYTKLDSYKRYDVYVSKQKFNNLYYIAVAENPRTLTAKFKAKGKNPQEAIQNLHAEVDKEIDVATKVSGRATVDFNVDFVRDILEMSTDTFYAKIVAGPKLVLAGPEMMEYPDIMSSEGFKPSSIRTYKGGEGTTKLPAVPLSASAAVTANLIANGRYVLGNEEIDKDGNRVFDLEFDSVVQDKNEKMRLRAPALTIGTVRVNEIVEQEQKTVAKTWDQMTPQEKISGVKGRTVWNEKTRKYYTVFDVPAKQETDEASLATMRDYFAGDEEARDPYEITKQRLHFAKDKNAKPTLDKRFRNPEEYEQWLKQNKLKQISGVKEDEEIEVKQKPNWTLTNKRKQ